MRFTLGQPVSVSAVLERNKGECRWERRDMPEPTHGIVVGYRNLNDGRMDSDYDEYSGRTSQFYVPKRGFQAVLVAFNLDRKPLVALAVDIAPARSSGDQTT